MHVTLKDNMCTCTYASFCIGLLPVGCNVPFECFEPLLRISMYISHLFNVGH